MRSVPQVKLFSYSFESCCAAVLRLRVPHVPPTQLSAWFRAGPAGGRWRAIRAVQRTARLSLLMLDSMDLVRSYMKYADVLAVRCDAVSSRLGRSSLCLAEASVRTCT